MDQQLFIRVRGRVQGPYDQAHLCGLARRGLFGRLHEVSEDGSTWVRAANYPELFTAISDGEPEEATAVDEPSTESAGVSEMDSRDPPVAQQAGEWHYLVGTQRFGPVGRDELLQMLSSGKLPEETSVWTPGMSDWASARQIPQLGVVGFQATGPHAIQESAVAGTREERLSEQAYQSLVGTRPWVLIVAILWLLNMGTLAIAGLVLFIMGAKASSETHVVQGVGCLLGGGLQLWLALLLLKFSGRIGALKFSRNVCHLEEALEAQRQFWNLLGVILLVVLVAGAILAIVSMAMS